MTAFIVRVSLLFAFIGCVLCCQADMASMVKRMQQQHPQKCMQCPMLKVSKLCEFGTMGASATCGKTSVSYAMEYDKKVCGRVTITCSARPPKLASAVIAVARIPIILSGIEANINDTEVNIETEIHSIEKRAAPATVVVDDGAEEPWAFISPERTVTTSAVLHCNQNGHWETTDEHKNQVIGIKEVHCIVGKVKKL